MLARSALFFVLAGLMEIGGGYLVWLCLREKWAWWVGALGALALVGYEVVPTLQPSNFGRVYAAYGGVFVAMAMLWGWWIDGQCPDRSRHNRRGAVCLWCDRHHVFPARGWPPWTLKASTFRSNPTTWLLLLNPY